MTVPRTKAARQARIVEILKNEPIRSQNELRAVLAAMIGRGRASCHRSAKASDRCRRP